MYPLPRHTGLSGAQERPLSNETNMSRKPTPVAETKPSPPSDYEDGALYVLETLRQEVMKMNDASREALRLLWSASPEVQSLLNFANPATNIVGDVENRVVKQVLHHLNERRQKS